MSRGFRAFLKPASTLLLATIAVASLSGCFNNISRKAASRSPDSNQVPTSSSGNASFTLSSVLRSAGTATLSFDLIGDGTGAMGQYCSPVSGGESATTCNCSFNYMLASGVSESIEVPTTYGEGNLVRCLYTQIPPEAAYVKVKLRVSTSGAVSTEVLYKFTGTGSASDLSDPESFAEVTRYQCRDIVTIPNLLDRNVYDPFQSEDRSISYPLNFYTTNLGGTYALYASKAIRPWYCPPIPNDTSEGMNLTVYSTDAIDGVDPVTTAPFSTKLIYPPKAGAFDRSTFHLSKSQVGVFTVPVNAYVAPQLVTSATSSAIAPPIGYGAAPIPNSSGGEDCPESATIPDDYQWAKLWLFRADLPSRNYVGSNKLGQLSYAACNPGTWANGTGVFASCGAGGGLTHADGIADRILGTNMCIRMQPIMGLVFEPCTTAQGAARSGPGCTTLNNGTQIAGYESYAKGSDIWEAITCGTALDPMGVCGASKVPREANPPVYDLDAGRARFDYLFVVTPASVNASDMQNSTGATARKYAPFRFPKASDCAQDDPDAAPACDINKAIQYGLKLHDVTANGDPPGNDPTRPGQFPVCVLQPRSS